MPGFEELRDASPASIRSLNDMLRWLFGKVQGGLTRAELSAELIEEMDTVDSSKLEDGSITADKIGTEAVGGWHIEEAAITNAHIQDLSAEKITAGDIAAERLQANVVDAVNLNASSAVIGSAKIGDLDAEKIKTGTLDADRIGAHTIKADKLETGTITAESAVIAVAAIGTAHIADGAITRAKIGNAAIGAAQIDEASITTAKIADGQITNAKIADGQITNAKIANATIDGTNIANATIDTANIKTGAIATALLGSAVVGDAQIDHSSTNRLKVVDADIVSLTANKLTAGTINAATIDVTNLKAANIAVGTINGYQITNGAIDTMQLSSGVNTSITTANTNASQALTDAAAAQSKADSSYTVASGKNKAYYQTTQPTGGTYVSGDMWFDTDDGYKMYVYSGSAWAASAYGTNAIAANAITATQIATDAVTAGKILAGAVIAGKIDTDAVTTANIQADAITTDKIAANAITATEIAAGVITGDKLVIDAITSREISAGAVSTAELAANAITAGSGKIANAAITTALIGDAQITGVKIANATITDANIGSLNADKITTGTMFAERIAGGALTLGGLVTDKAYNGKISFKNSSGNEFGTIDRSGIIFNTDLTMDFIKLYGGFNSSVYTLMKANQYEIVDTVASNSVTMSPGSFGVGHTSGHNVTIRGNASYGDIRVDGNEVWHAGNAAKSGTGLSMVTGKRGASGFIAMWDADGNLTDTAPLADTAATANLHVKNDFMHGRSGAVRITRSWAIYKGSLNPAWWKIMSFAASTSTSAATMYLHGYSNTPNLSKRGAWELLVCGDKDNTSSGIYTRAVLIFGDSDIATSDFDVRYNPATYTYTVYFNIPQYTTYEIVAESITGVVSYQGYNVAETPTGTVVPVSSIASTFATAAQGTLAENALPKSNGTFGATTYVPSGCGFHFTDSNGNIFVLRTTGAAGGGSDLAILQDNSASTPYISFNPTNHNVAIDGTSTGGRYNKGHLVMGTFHLWVDLTGRLRIKNGAPTSDTDGTVVGTQA